jgi:predicted nuclease of restriction endonuclease-like (RecB) superfamily
MTGAKRPNLPNGEKALYERIRELIIAARRSVARGVDLAQVHTNFEIGRRIVQEEQKGKRRADYGEEVIMALAKRLAGEFGNGFSRSNLEYMRRFYLAYEDRGSYITQALTGQLSSGKRVQTSPIDEKSQSLEDQFPISQSLTGELPYLIQTRPHPFTLSWTHYVLLLGIKNPDERSFYEIESTQQNWTVRELKRQVSACLYERLSLSRNKKAVRRLAMEGQVVASPEDVLKEPYVLEFLGLDEKAGYSESDLETAIINRIEQFLLELGKGFLFEARQKRFTFDEDHFFVDLVFYNRLLRCYVVIDLKLDKLTHQDLGQMQMYVNYFDRHVKLPEENPTIRILLCKRKNQAIAELTLPKDANIHAREYQLYLPSKEELRRKLTEWVREAGAEYKFEGRIQTETQKLS